MIASAVDEAHRHHLTRSLGRHPLKRHVTPEVPMNVINRAQGLEDYHDQASASFSLSLRLTLQ